MRLVVFIQIMVQISRLGHRNLSTPTADCSTVPQDVEPARIRGLSQFDFIERLQSSALNSAHQGGWCFFLSL
jgi:hypothetical protein